MASVTLTAADLAPFASIDSAKAQAMIDDALAMARLAAPCLAGNALTDDQAAAAKAIIRGAVLRWEEAGSGVLTQHQRTLGSASIGESFDTRQTRRGMFWPSEIGQLQDICKAASNETSGAFSVDTTPAGVGAHMPWCDIYFGAASCSCGASLTNYQYPIYEGASTDVVP